MRREAFAKLNLSLVVGERRDDGLHEVATVLQRIDLADAVELDESDELRVEGFEEDSLVRGALGLLARTAGLSARWRVRIEKRIPVAAGLGGGSADAAAALALANETLAEPLAPALLERLAAELGADVPFFLAAGPKLGEGAGERLRQVDLPQDYTVLVALAPGPEKPSTGDVYRRFDAMGGGPGFVERRAALLAALERRDLAALPPNDLADAAGGGDLVRALRALGAFRADVTGAGPAAYGLFEERDDAERAAAALATRAALWLAKPVW
ncbi:MAG: 4-(cytidine 5'-diphospho)-2-C-methyl-D-erythritol kinase [Actinomycetota bacterium]|nr:4-(cytidine 5'-diphospho)-2-C-methyl-D-erythritol kinase [Actinomycetota bacterium]